MAITAPTPITMPSMVRKDLSLFARRESSATLTVSPTWSIRGSATATSAASTAAAATAETAARAAASARAPASGHAGHAASHPLADVLLRLGASRLRFRDAEEHHLLARLQTVHDLRVVEIAEAEAHDARLEAVIRLDERDLRAARPTASTAPAPARVSASSGEAASRLAPARPRGVAPGLEPGGALGGH